MRSAGVVLGFDYGTRRIGTALGNLITATARPLSTVREADWPALAALIAEWAPERLLVGLPLADDGSQQQPIAKAAERFANRLGARFALPVERVDERFSTLEAAERLRAARRSGARCRRLARGDADAVAAQVIVETWLAERAASRA